MAGFASVDDFISELTQQGKFWNQDFTKVYAATNVYAAGVAVAGRSYDLSGYDQGQQAHGNHIFNGFLTSGLAGWTLSSANLSWDAVNTAVSKTGAGTETFTQNTECVNGVSYSVTYTIAGYTGTGNVVVSLGGTNGANRTANGTYRETIVCGATANAPLVVTFPTTLSAGRVDNIVVTRDLGFTPYSDVGRCREMGIWHGGDVSPDTKHIVNLGANTNAATAAGSILHVVDLLGCYPRIRTDLSTSQALNNTLSLPRYTDGKGVRAFYSLNAVNGANAQNFAMSYTNPASVAGRSLGGVVANTASGVTGHMGHSGVAAGNFGPWLPLAGGDSGILSVQSAQFSAASASAGFIDLVLCRPLTRIPVTTAFVASERDLLTQLPSLPRVRDGAVLGLIVQAGGILASGNAYNGYIECAWG
jgi:hypothetical protein